MTAATVEPADVPITSVMRSEIFAETLHEVVLPFQSTLSQTDIAAALRDVQAVLFDRRGDKVILAVLVPSTQSFLLCQLDTTAGTLSHSNELQRATHIAAITATRHTGPKDLLVLTPQSELQLLSASAVRTAISAPAGLGQIKALRSSVGSCVSLVTVDGQEHRIALSQRPREPLAKQILEVLSGVLSLDSFRHLLDAFDGEPSGQDLLDGIAGIVDETIGRDATTTSSSASSPFAALRRQHEHNSDRAFAEWTPSASMPSIDVSDRQWPKLSPRDVQTMLLALHLLSESNKMLISRHADGMRMVPLLARIATRLGFHDWMDAYGRMGVRAPSIKSCACGHVQ